MREVAEKAGVSIKTVSRVVNNQQEISETTRQQVRAVIDELGYRPNLIARGLVTQRTHTIGLVVNDITNPFFPEVARGVLDTARAKDFNIFLCNSDDDPEEEKQTLQTLSDQNVDGIIIFPCLQENIRAFAELHRPFVVINNQLEHPHVSAVITNNYEGAKLAVEHLIERGHTEIAMLSGKPAVNSKRMRGFEDGMQNRGLTPITHYILSGPPTFDRGYESARQLLTQYPHITAIFAYNDLLATGAIQACKHLGRRVPEDCAIVGFDDIHMASLVDPPLTTVRINKYQLGQTAMERMVAMLETPQESFSSIELDVELIVREST
jgi:LacI family transcriptional regulator